MSDPYDPYDPALDREQAAYDQEDAAAQQSLLAPPQTFTGYGEPAGQPEQAIPTPPQPALQPPPQQQPALPQPQYAQVGETFDVSNFQPEPLQQARAQPQQPGGPRPLAPYPQVAPRANRQQRAQQEYQDRFGTIISDEDFGARPELAPQPTGGFGSVVALDFQNFGHDVLSAVNAFAKNTLNMPLPQLEAVNAQLKEHIDKVRDGLDPERRAAQDVSIFDPSSITTAIANGNLGAVAESYAVMLATGILGGLGPGLAAKFAVKTGARIVAGSAAAAGRGATAAAIGGAGVTGALQQTGARYEDYATTIDKMTDEDKSKSVMYQGFRAQNMDDAAAKEAMKRQFPMLQQLGVNFVSSTGIAAVTPGLGGALPRLSTRGRNIAAGAAEAGVSAGVGTAGSAAIQEQAKVEAGTQPAINWGQVAAEGAVAAGLGAGFGGAFGVFHGTRVDKVTPSGVPPEHTAALNAAGIGRSAEPGVVGGGPGGTPLPPEPVRVRPDPLTQGPPARYAGGEGIGGTPLPPEPALALPRRGPQVAIGPDESFFAPPTPRYDLPADTVLPPADPSAAWRPPLPTVQGATEGPPARMAGAGVGGAPLAPEPSLARPLPREQVGPGGVPMRPEPALAQALPVRPVAPAAGPGGTPLPTEPYRAAPIQRGEPPSGAGPGGTPLGPEPYPPAPPRPLPPSGAGPGGTLLQAEPTPAAAVARAAAPSTGPGGAPLPVEPTPARAPARPQTPAGPGGAPLPAEPVRRAPRRIQGPGESPGGTPLPEGQQRAAAPRQITEATRGEGFTTQPRGRTEARPSEGMTWEQLGKKLDDLGVSKPMKARLLSHDARAAAVDKLTQEAAARGEPAPAPRGAEAREPAPAARPSEGMSHKELGKALQDKGVSAREVNTKLAKREARAAEYDRIVRSEEGETVTTRHEAGPEETKGHPAGEAEDRAWRALKPERTADGKYKGAPEWVTKPRHLKQLRNLMKQLIKEGEKGRYWYEDSMKKIMAVTRGNLREAERVTGLIAIYSPQRPVPTNTGFAVKAYGQWRRGEPIRIGSEAQDAKAKAWLDSGQDWGGRKTNNFYLNLMHELITAHPEVLEPGNNRLNIPPDVALAIKGATVDLWVLRALGHRVDSAGGVNATGSAATKYGFSELEIKRLAGELNASVPVGEQRWLPHQVQAALWSAIKARFELKSVKDATWAESEKANFAKRETDEKGVTRLVAPDKNGPERQGHMAIWRKHALAADPADVARIIDTARGDFAAALERMSQHVTVEAIPSKDLGHPIYNASREAQEQFTREAHALLLDEDGNNLLAQKIGVNLGYDTYGAGSFEGKVSPNVVTTLVPEKPAGFFDRTKAKMYARAAQFIYRQDAVPFFRADPSYNFEGDYSVRNAASKVIRKFDEQAEAQAYADREAGRTVEGGELARGRHLEFEQPLDEAAQARLLTAIGEELGPDAGFTKVGDREAVVINFRGDDGIPFVDDVRFHDAVERIAARTDLEVSKVSKFGSEGEYGPVHNWRSDRTGEGIADAAGGSPAFQTWLRDRHAAFGKLLDDWADPEARLAASRPGDGGGAGPVGRSSLELPEARAPPDPRLARERAADRRAERVEGTPEAEAPAAPNLERPYTEASRAQRDDPTATTSPLSRVMKDDRVNAPVRAAVEAGGSLHDGLRAIANSPFINQRLPHVAAYARTMLRLAPDLELRPSETVRRGAFVSEENLATGRRSEYVEVREKSAEVMLHEATHGVVGHYVDSLHPGSREFQVLTTIRDEFARGAELHGRLGDEQVAYALSNPHELHAMLRTNPEMHDLMRGIVPSAEYRARMAQLGYPVGPAKSLWQSFVRFIRQALHLPQNVTSLMDHVMRPLDDLAEAGARFNRDLPASTRDSTVYRRGWEPEPLVARTEHELPSFSDAKDWLRDKTDPMGVRGNVSSGMRRGLRQVIPTHQLTGFNRHLFNSSEPGRGNLADALTRAAEGVERVSREYAEGTVGPDWQPSASGKTREQAFREQVDKIDPVTAHTLTASSRLDTHPAYPPDHPLNSHSRATPDQYDVLKEQYNDLTPTQRQVFRDTFAMQRQLRIDEGDAAMRGIGKSYLQGVNDTQIETLVRQMRTMEGVNELLNNMDRNPVARAFGDQWTGNRAFVEAIAKEWKRGWINNYVPLHRSGDWVVNYTDPDTGEKGMISRYTMREAENARLQLEIDGAEPSLVLSRERRTPSDIPRLTIVNDFEHKLRGNSSLNADQVVAARDLLTKVLLDNSRFAGRNRERLGVHGADPAKLREAMAQRFQALKNSVGHLEFGPQYEAGLNAMQRHIREMGRGAGTVRIPDGSTGGRPAGNADAIQAQQYFEDMRRRKPVSEDANTLTTKMAHNATMLTYFKFLASPAQTIMNGLDTYVQAIPRIGATFGVGRATTAMARASAEIMPRQFARGLAGTGAAARGRLDPGEWNSATQIRDHLIAGSRRNDATGITALFDRMQQGNLIGFSSYRDLQAMAKGGNGWIRHRADMAADMVSILHNKMEDANRAAVALAAYDVHFRKNGDRAAAIDYADHILRTAMPNFGLSNKPPLATGRGAFGAWGIPVAQFRQHGMWAYSQMALDIRNAFKGADAATKTEARYALAFTIGMQGLMFGALNWLADPLRYLWGAYDALSDGKAKDHSHDFRRYAAQLFGTTGGQVVSRGVLGAAGYGPYTVERMGMINAALVPKMEGDWKNPKDVTYMAMTAIAGVPSVSAATEVITGLSSFVTGDYKLAAQDLLPKLLRDPLKAYRGETEGQVSRRGNVQQTPEQISTLDTVYQVLGFKSARQGERTEAGGAVRQIEAEVRASREAATKEAARVLATGTAAERRNAAQMIAQHNFNYPGSKIDGNDVANYRKVQLQRLKDPSFAGVTVPKGLQPLIKQQVSWANY